MNFRLIRNIIGRIVVVEGAFMLPALLIALFTRDTKGALAFALTIALSALLGLPFARKSNRGDLFARDGFITVGLAWIAVSAVGALPFCISGAIPNYVDCFFETVSGFTTTGASILTDVESLSKSMLYWRSFTHWLGGMGVLVFVLALSPVTKKDSGESMHLLRAESPGIQATKLTPRMRQSAATLYKIYIGLTLLQLLLLIGHMPLFDALTLTFGTAGTGGFGVKGDSVASYSPYCQWVITIFMLVFSVNFNLYYMALLRQFRRAAKNEELRLFLVVVLISIGLIAYNIRGSYSGVEETIRTAAFQVASIVSTTGYSTADFDVWPELSRMVIVLLMFMGACAGSTGGGAKVVRLLVMAKSAIRSVYQTIRPNSVRLVRMDGEVLDEQTVGAVNTYMSLYFILFAITALLVSLADGITFESAFTAAAACLNNIGPGLGSVGPAASYADLSIFSKLVLSLSMLVGRLEIYPILVLFFPSTWRK